MTNTQTEPSQAFAAELAEIGVIRIIPPVIEPHKPNAPQGWRPAYVGEQPPF